MDYQALVNCCSVASAILSVEMTPEGRCGDIRIVCANQPYRESMGSAYHDGMLYQELVPQDPKFEDFCFRAAHKNQRMHAYVEAKAFDGWADQVMIPLQPQGPGIGYCQFLIEFTKAADPTRMAAMAADGEGMPFGVVSVDVYEAFKVADGNMYADKESYYNSHPEIRR